MKNHNIIPAVAAITGAVVVGASVSKSIKTHRIERARRAEIEKNLQLDLAAIKAASEVTRQWAAAEERFVPMYEYQERFYEEIKFQKIAIREK